MRVGWDLEKALANLAKHGVEFQDAAEVFSDPLARSIQDRHEAGEERWQTLGLVGGLVLLVVAHTWGEDEDGEVVRIISARRATRRERREYERGG